MGIDIANLFFGEINRVSFSPPRHNLNISKRNPVYEIILSNPKKIDFNGFVCVA
jgi:hypothetical protein